jgi:hypothetical protein
VCQRCDYKLKYVYVLWGVHLRGNKSDPGCGLCRGGGTEECLVVFRKLSKQVYRVDSLEDFSAAAEDLYNIVNHVIVMTADDSPPALLLRR